MKPKDLTKYQWETMVYYTQLFVLLFAVLGLGTIALLVGLCIERGIL
jgi:hypothetical protein